MPVVYKACLQHLALCLLVFLSITTASPTPSFWGGPDETDKDNPTSAAKRLRSQYNFPKEVLAVLSLIGSDIIQKACAQEAGTFTINPVAFSFGWVAYAFSALMSAFSDGSLMPETEIQSVVIDVKRGHCRKNESWVLGRLIRDLELDNTRPTGGLGVYFYMAKDATGKPTRSALDWIIFVVVTIIQFILAILPITFDHKNWTILYVTGAGTVFAFCSGSLRSWRREKYNEQKKPLKAGVGRTFALTRGNGHGHVFVITIEGKDKVIPFDVLATIPRAKLEHGTGRRISIGILALCWVVVLIAVGGMEQDTWILLLIGGLGMLQNVWVAGRRRTPKEHGIPLELYHVEERPGNQEAVLHDVEEFLPGLGLSLLEQFFPGGVFQDKHWNKMRQNLERDQMRERLKEKVAMTGAEVCQDLRAKAEEKKAKAEEEKAKAQSIDNSKPIPTWEVEDPEDEMLIFKNKGGHFITYQPLKT